MFDNTDTQTNGMRWCERSAGPHRTQNNLILLEWKLTMTAQLIGFDAVVYSVLDLSQQNVLFANNFISDDFVVMRLVTCVRVPILVVLPYLHTERESECRFGFQRRKICHFSKWRPTKKQEEKEEAVTWTNRRKKWKYKWDRVPFGRVLCQCRCCDDWIVGVRKAARFFQCKCEVIIWKAATRKHSHTIKAVESKFIAW